MTDVLILGGTGWLSTRIAERWLDAGATVTCLARGGRDAPYGARLVVGDRDAPGAYAAVTGREWDEVVDISSRTASVTSALAALAGSARHWTYISSISAYASNAEAGADEAAALAEPAQSDDDDYARQKAGGEAAVRAALGGRAAVVRPGLIVGPGDPTDRFGYWVGRLALAGAEEVLVPDAPEAGVQVIDVDDVADFVIAVGRERFTGAINAVGDPLHLTRFLAEAREVAGHRGDLAHAEPDWLRAHDVAYWAGPRSLPLWLPDDMPGFTSRSNAAYRLLGGRIRPLRTTLERTLDDERIRGLERPRSAGLSREEERELLADLRRPGKGG